MYSISIVGRLPINSNYVYTFSARDFQYTFNNNQIGFSLTTNSSFRTSSTFPVLLNTANPNKITKLVFYYLVIENISPLLAFNTIDLTLNVVVTPSTPYSILKPLIIPYTVDANLNYWINVVGFDLTLDSQGTIDFKPAISVISASQINVTISSIRATITIKQVIFHLLFYNNNNLLNIIQFRSIHQDLVITGNSYSSIPQASSLATNNVMIGIHTIGISGTTTFDFTTVVNS